MFGGDEEKSKKKQVVLSWRKQRKEYFEKRRVKIKELKGQRIKGDA